MNTILQTYADLITSYGLNSALMVYLLIWLTKKFNSKIDNLTNSIKDLTSKIDTLIRIIESKRN